MSTKRGRRNGKWHKEKSNRRLQELRDILRYESRQKEYIPLEKPIFAGWDMSVVVDGFRKDRQDLEAVIAAIGWSSCIFIRNVSHIRSLRRSNHSFFEYLTIRSAHYNGGNSRISTNTYEGLTEEVKKYFGRVCYDYLGIAREAYELKWNFPFYALKVSVKKSYYKYKVVYDTVAQSEYEKLDNRLYLVDCKAWRSRYRDSFVKANKAAWKDTLKSIVGNQYSPDEVIDNYSEIFKNTNNKRDYGWS
jgi:hypothetical protein